jgi:predicted GNAT superfamily acetyltransferase
MRATTIELRLVQTYAEYMACEDLQREVWGEFGVVPHHMLITVQKNGGLVLGAFDAGAPGRPLVGFVYGFLARDAHGPKHASHMAAVSARYRDAGIGERLKWGQREIVLAQGLQRITWTFDPLISRNARLNIAKLGAVCRTYIANLYGPEPEDPQGELPSDRFQVEWWIASERVQARRDGAAPPSAEALRARAPLANPDPLEPSVAPAGDRLLLQIPTDIEALKQADMAKARAWRYQVRAIAEAAFAGGFSVTDYARDGDVGLYLLARGAA